MDHSYLALHTTLPMKRYMIFGARLARFECDKYGVQEYTCVPGIARRAGLTCGASSILKTTVMWGISTGI